MRVQKKEFLWWHSMLLITIVALLDCTARHKKQKAADRVIDYIDNKSFERRRFFDARDRLTVGKITIAHNCVNNCKYKWASIHMIIAFLGTHICLTDSIESSSSQWINIGRLRSISNKNNKIVFLWIWMIFLGRRILMASECGFFRFPKYSTDWAGRHSWFKRSVFYICLTNCARPQIPCTICIVPVPLENTSPTESNQHNKQQNYNKIKFVDILSFCISIQLQFRTTNNTTE